MASPRGISVAQRVLRVISAAVFAVLGLAGATLAQDRPAPAAGTATTTSGGAAQARRPGVGDPVAGEQIYSESCVACHGADGKGGHAGDTGETMPLSESLSMDDILRIVAPGHDDAPVFETTYSDKELRDLAAYITQTLLRSGTAAHR
jgi:mono/diheme cytochrome c family protein